MTGRAGERTTEMMEEVPRRTSRDPLRPHGLLILFGLEANGLLDFQGDMGSLLLYGGTFAWSYSVSIIGYF